MGFFDFLKPRGSTAGGGEPAAEEEQAVLVYLDGVNLPDEVYEEYDLATLEDQLVSTLAARTTGEFDGNEVGPEETCLYLYGPDAEALFTAIEPVLRQYPLCQNARVVIRQGPPGAAQRELRLETG